jgi:uncharacterized repeat protein (TIGR02543 family)
MKHFGKSAFAALLVAMLAGLAVGCSEYTDDPAPILQHITVTSMPTKVVYVQGEALDISGLVVTGYYSDGTTRTETVSLLNVSGYNANTPGIQTLTVTVNGKTADFPVTVNAGGDTTEKTLVINDITQELFGSEDRVQIGIFEPGTSAAQALAYENIVAGADSGDGTISVSGTAEPYTATAELYSIESETRWTGSGTYDIYLIVNDEGYYRKQNAAFNSTTTTVSATTFSPVSFGEEYTVTFDADGGDPASQILTVEGGGSVGGAMPSNPNRSGYSFDGWYTAQNGGGAQFTATTPVTADITVYAKWTAGAVTQYTVTFDADGGDPASQTVTVDSGAEPSITYRSVSGGEWTVQGDGRRQSPATAHSDTSKARISFTSSTANGSISIQLDVSSESGCDYAFISTLDNASATYSSGYYTGSLISGEQTVTVTIPVPTAGSHFVDIGYQKDPSVNNGSDCAWFKVTDSSGLCDPVDMPSIPTKDDYVFGGWWTERDGGGTEFTATTPVTADIRVYAKWSTMPTTSLQAALTWLAANAVEGGEYTIPLSATESLAPQTLSYSGKTVSITITGDSTERMVRLSSSGSLFTVGSGVTLTLGENVTLQGRTGNNAALVNVNSGGTLVMETGAKITSNTNSDSNGSFYGGGVRVNGGTFTMNGGAISGNTVGTLSSSSSSNGGGVYVSSGTFTLNGGAISGNTAASYGYANGGGVSVAGGTFTQSGGTISDNTASTYNYNANGGGVSVDSSGTFIQSGGTIGGNTASSTSSSYNLGSGGGVYVVSNGTFIKESGGVIYGSNASTALQNTAQGGDTYGHAVYVNSSPAKKRNHTVGEGVTLDSWGDGAAGGWVDPTQTAIQISLQTDASALTNTTIAVDQPAQFSVGSGYASYAWYWDVELIEGATSATYTLEDTSEAGIYELAVFVTTGTGKLLSARCRVIITNGPVSPVFTYSSVSGGEWTVLSDGRRQSPATAHNATSKVRISFTSAAANESVSIQLAVSSESGYDYAFISELDNASATYQNGYYTGSLISGEQTVTITIPVPTAGAHFIDIGYRKDSGGTGGSDCAWFKVLN